MPSLPGPPANPPATAHSSRRPQPLRQQLRRGLLFLFFLLLPITLNYYSPYLIIEGSARGILTLTLVFWTLFFLTSLVLGRLGCAYFCPLGGAQLALDGMIGRDLARIRCVRWIKYVLAVLWVGGIVAALVHAGGLHHVSLLYQTETGISSNNIAGLLRYYAIALLPLGFGLLLGRRGFCHYLCFWSVLNIAGTRMARWLRLPHLQLHAEPARCRACQSCSRACPMSLPVTEMVRQGDLKHPECILCGTCIDTCEHQAIRYAVKS